MVRRGSLREIENFILNNSPENWAVVHKKRNFTRRLPEILMEVEDKTTASMYAYLLCNSLYARDIGFKFEKRMRDKIEENLGDVMEIISSLGVSALCEQIRTELSDEVAKETIGTPIQSDGESAKLIPLDEAVQAILPSKNVRFSSARLSENLTAFKEALFSVSVMPTLYFGLLLINAVRKILFNNANTSSHDILIQHNDFDILLPNILPMFVSHVPDQRIGPEIRQDIKEFEVLVNPNYDFVGNPGKSYLQPTIYGRIIGSWADYVSTCADVIKSRRL